MPQPSTTQSVLKGVNPFLEADIPDSEEIYEPTPFGISALTNVDHLMNEIFQGVEQSLEQGSVLPSDLHEEPEPQWVAPFAAPLLSPGLIPSALEAVTPYSLPQDDLLNDPDLEELLGMEQGGMDQGVAKPRKSGSGFLLPAVLATLILTGGLFVAFKFRLYQMIPGFSAPGVVEGSAPQPAVSESAQIGKDQQFLEYVGRSLDRINRTATRSSSSAGTAAALPPAPSVAPSPLVIERYVPVSQPPLFGSFTNQPGTTPGNPTSPIAAAPPPPPTVATVRVPSAPTVRLPAPQTAAPAQPAPPSPVAAIAPSIDSSETHALIGLLELGDRSAALLEVNGVPQRIRVGEKIGASGWKIMSIANQTAIIQRNSEVRSIYVGQKF
jgi:hypothetical protein